MPPVSIRGMHCARRPVIDADGGESLPPTSAAIGLDLDGDRRGAPASLTSKPRVRATGQLVPETAPREELEIA